MAAIESIRSLVYSPPLMTSSSRGGPARGWIRKVVLLTLAIASVGQSWATALTVTETGYTMRSLKYSHQKVKVTTFVAGSYGIRVITPSRSWGTGLGPSAQGQRTGALVAVNGDLKVHDGPRIPRRPVVINGELWTTAWLYRQPGYVLTTNADGTRATIAHPNVSVTATIDGTPIDVGSWNFTQPRNGALVAFTARGGKQAYPSKRSCFALLAPTSTAVGAQIVVTYSVEERHLGSQCDTRPIQPPSHTPHDVVLAGMPLRGMDTRPVKITFNYGFPGAWNMMGGIPMVVKDGVNIGKLCPQDTACDTKRGPDHPFYKNNPRTALGITHGCVDTDPATQCTYLVVTVDGRLSGWSCCGLRFPALGNLMVELGAWDAVNLDGGGSTAMWVRKKNTLCQAQKYTAMQATRGCIVNRPSYTERNVVDGVGVFALPTP